MDVDAVTNLSESNVALTEHRLAGWRARYGRTLLALPCATAPADQAIL